MAREREEATGPLRVLSIDGGGVRGLVPALFLQDLETKTGKRVQDLFDVVIGCSSGALTAVALVTNRPGGAPMPASEVVELFDKKAKNVFKKPPVVLPGFGVVGAKYDSKGLRKLIVESVGERTPLTEATVSRLLIPAVDLQTHQLKLFDSAREGSRYTMFDVAMASTAAPTYFDPHSVKAGGPSGATQDRQYVDGGLAASNPSALAVAREIDAVFARGLLLLSLGTGTARTNKPKDFGNVGILGWAEELPPLVINSSADATRRVVKDLLATGSDSAQRKQIRIDPDLSDAVALDASNSKSIDLLKNAYASWKKTDEGRRAMEELVTQLPR
jgi:patatin-like phospholipase/acyl hydrolase